MYEYEQERRWESMVRSVPAQTLGLSTVWVRVASARGIPAGDKRGTSDAYAVGELINVQTGKPLSKSRKLKTNTAKKTLDPEWNEDAEWVEIEEDVSSLALKVVVFDADVFSSDVLAGVKVPLADFIGKEGDTVTDTMKWYPLDAMGNTDMESGTLSEIQISVCVQAGVPKKIAPAPAAAAAAAAAAATIPEELRVFPSRSEDSKSTVWVKVVGARDIPAADKGGTSDAYAVYELVDCATGKPLAKPRKTKTKTAKKTLNPVWDMNESTWGSIGEAVDTLALKVTLFDADTLTSELLGGVTIPLLAFVGVEGEMATEVLEWYTLEAVGKMDVVSASGKVQVRVGVQKAGFDMSTVRVKLKAARGISAADASGTSDPYAVAELVELGTGTLLSKNWKTKTKVVKKTLDPVWSGEDEALWGGIQDDPCGLGLKVVVWDSDLLSGNDPLGAVTIPLTTILAGSGQAGVDEWYPLSWVGEGKKMASGKEREGGGGASSAGSVQVAIQVDAAKNPRPSPKSSVANNIKKPLVEEKKKNFVTVSVKIHEARDLVAADKGGTSDPYAVAELVDSSTGKSLKRPCRKKTRAVSRTLHPVWKREQVKWEHVEVAEDAGSLDLKVNLFDNDVLAKDDLLGGITVPLSWGSGPNGTGEQWYPLSSVERMAVGAASGKVKISFQAEKTDGPQKKKLLTSESALPLRKPTWEERLKACQKGGGVRLDFARLSLGDAGLPKTAFSPALGLGGTLVGLNLKANTLLSFPPYLCKALPMLQSLVLSNNSLTHLPDDLALLEHLEVLAIDSNAFEVLPPCVFAPRTLAASLLKLHCGANKLNSLPAEIGNLLALESLVVTGNQLESLPSEVAFLAEEGMLEDLDITGNPCTSPSSKWDPPAPIARLLGMRTVFRSQPQRAEAIQRSIALRKRLTARRAAIGSSAKS